MEVFVAYTKDSLIKDLRSTLEAWDKIDDAEPVAIQIPEKKFEILRRVTAENMAKGDYVLCDLGCVPDSEQAVLEIKNMFKAQEKVGLIRFGPNDQVCACRKGIIERWPSYKGGSYQIEHRHAYLIEGYLSVECPTLSYHQPDVH